MRQESEHPPTTSTAPLSPASPHLASNSELAAARLCKRIANGFGVSDTAKFAAFAAEVVTAAKRYQADEIDHAAELLVKRNKRPNIGDVYDALVAAKKSASPSACRSLARDVHVAVGWLSGASFRYFDWTPEFGASPEPERVFVPERTVERFVADLSGEAKDRLSWLISEAARDDKARYDDRETRDFVWKLRYAKNQYPDLFRARSTPAPAG